MAEPEGPKPILKRRRKLRPAMKKALAWYETNSPPWLKTVVNVVKESPSESLVLGMALGISSIVYLVWMAVVIPRIWSNWPGYYLGLAYLSTTWIMYGFLAHLYLICRGAAAATVPPIISMPLDLIEFTADLDQNSDNLGESGDSAVKKRPNTVAAEPVSESTPGLRLCTKCMSHMPISSWLCSFCKKCIPDKKVHSCDENQLAYGIRNPVNFLGLFFYLAIGGLSACVTGAVHIYTRSGNSENSIVSDGNWGVALFKCSLYWSAFLDLPGFLTLISALGCMGLFCCFLEYAELAVNKQANESHDSAPAKLTAKNAYTLLGDFLGPKAIHPFFFPIICGTPETSVPVAKERYD